MNTYQKGFSAIALLLILLVVGVGGGAAYKFTSENRGDDKDTASSKSGIEESSDTNKPLSSEELTSPKIESYTPAVLFGDVVDIRGSGFGATSTIVTLIRNEEWLSVKRLLEITALGDENHISFTMPTEAKNRFGETIPITEGHYFMQILINEDYLSHGVGIVVANTIEFSVWTPSTPNQEWVIGEPHAIQWSDNLNTNNEETKYDIYLIGNFNRKIGTIASGFSGSSYIWTVGEFEENGITLQPGVYRFKVEKTDAPYPVSSLGRNPITLISSDKEEIANVEVKIDGSDILSVKRDEIVEVTWVSENVQNCDAVGSHVPTVGGGLWTTDSIGISGSKKIYARHSNFEDATKLYITVSCVGIRSDGVTPVTVSDSATIHIIDD